MGQVQSKRQAQALTLLGCHWRMQQKVTCSLAGLKRLCTFRFPCMLYVQQQPTFSLSHRHENDSLMLHK